MTAVALNTKIRKVENQISDHGKYITSANFIKFVGSVFDTILKQMYLVRNTDVRAVSHRSSKNKEKTEKLKMFDLSYLFGKNFVGDDSFSRYVCFSSKI